MQYTKEFEIFSFPFWSGARDRTKDLSYLQMKELQRYIEEMFEGTTPTDTQINDFVWFECDEFLETLKTEEND